jgi:hypothetical protein
MLMGDVVKLSSQDPDADGEIQYQTFSLGSKASTVVTEPGSCPLITELAATAQPSQNLAAAGQPEGRLSSAACNPGELGRMGRCPAAG